MSLATFVRAAFVLGSLAAMAPVTGCSAQVGGDGQEETGEAHQALCKTSPCSGGTSSGGTSGDDDGPAPAVFPTRQTCEAGDTCAIGQDGPGPDSTCTAAYTFGEWDATGKLLYSYSVSLCPNAYANSINGRRLVCAGGTTGYTISFDWVTASTSQRTLPNAPLGYQYVQWSPMVCGSTCDAQGKNCGVGGHCTSGCSAPAY